MGTLDIIDINNKPQGKLELNEKVFQSEVKIPLMHEVVLMQLANRRAGTHSTKTRGEVKGSGKKPWKQKGTGNARAGTKKSPLWRSGGTVFGPKPRDYSYSMPKKKVKRSLISALSAQHKDNIITVLDSFAIESGKTKDAEKIFQALGMNRKVLVVLDELDAKTKQSLQNLPYVKLLKTEALNTYDVINAKNIVFTKSSIEKVEEVLSVC